MEAREPTEKLTEKRRHVTPLNFGSPPGLAWQPDEPATACDCDSHSCGCDDICLADVPINVPVCGAYG